MDGPGMLAFLLETLDMLKVLVVVIGMSLYHALRAVLPGSLLPKRGYAGDVVLVTGSGSGLGRLLARRMAAMGAQLVLWDRDEKGNKETLKLVKAAGATATAYTVDLADRNSIKETAQKVKEEIGVVDVLVNNAGIVSGKPIDECTDDQITRTFDVNILAHFWMVRAFVGGMRTKGRGQIVSVASGAGLFGACDLTDYCASKFAAVGLNESLGLELETKGFPGVTTTTVCPYYINTGMFDGVTTRFNNVLPILEPEYAVAKIVEAMETEAPILLIPRVLYVLYFLKGFFPVRCGHYLAHQLGVSHSMDHFKGRNDKTK